MGGWMEGWVNEWVNGCGLPRLPHVIPVIPMLSLSPPHCPCHLHIIPKSPFNPPPPPPPTHTWGPPESVKIQ